MWVTIGSGEGRGLTVRVEGERFVVGSGAECHLIVRDEKAAPLHAYFETRADGRVVLHDLGTESGTFVNGERIDAPALLEGDEEIRIGETTLVASVADPEAEAKLAGAQEGGDVDAAARPPEGSVAARDTEAADRQEAEREGHPPLPVAPLPADAPPEPVAARQRRRLRDLSRRAMVLGGTGAALGAIGLVVGLVAVLGGGGDDEASLASVVRAAKPSTVRVSGKEARSLGRGTGWVLDGDRGLIVTNFHVINGASAFEIGTPDGTKQRATIVGAAPCEDLAVLRVAQTEGLETMPLGAQGDLAEGDPVVAVGFPASAGDREQLTATAGVVSVARSRVEAPGPDAPTFPNMVQTDAALSPGNSGGPLVDRDNRLVGVNTAILGHVGGQPVQGQGYAIGVDRVKRVVRELSRGRSQGWAGIGIAPAPKRLLAQERRRGGMLAAGAVPGSPADEAGLGPGPVLITEINGSSLERSLKSYCGAVRGIRSGQSAIFEVVLRPGAPPRRVRVGFD